MKKRELTIRWLWWLSALVMWCASCDSDGPKDLVDDQNIPAEESDPGVSEPLVLVGEANLACDTRAGDAPAVSAGEADGVKAEADGHTLKVTDSDASLNCCLGGWMEATVDGRTIDVVEVEDPDRSGACRCVCSRELSIDIPELDAGVYEVTVYRSEVDDAGYLAAFRVEVDDDGVSDIEAITDDASPLPRLADIEIGECGESEAALPRTREAIEDGIVEERPDNEPDVEAPAPTPDAPTIYLVARGDTAAVIDEAMPVNCCADVEVELSVAGHLITVVENEVPSDTGLCRCMCQRSVEVMIEGLGVGAYAVNVVRAFADGTESVVANLPIDCVESPDDWAYNGIACVN